MIWKTLVLILLLGCTALLIGARHLSSDPPVQPPPPRSTTEQRLFGLIEKACNESGMRYHITVTRSRGALGDRMKGAVNALVLGLLTQRGVFFDPDYLGERHAMALAPCWRPLPDRWDPPRGEPWSLFVMESQSDRLDQTTLFHEKSLVGAWDVNSNFPFADELVTNPHFPDTPVRRALVNAARQGRLFHAALRSLFTPGREVARAVDSLIQQWTADGTRYLIGVHIRAGDELMGQRRRRAYHPLRKESNHVHRIVPVGALDCFAPEALSLWHALPDEERALHPGGPVFFVSSDYPSGARRVHEQFEAAGLPSFNASEVSGRVNHIVNMPNESHERAFVDWWVLARSRQLVISISGFSETAAKYSCAPVSYFTNFPHQREHNVFDERSCQQHFARMRGPGLCVPEVDGANLAEVVYAQYKGVE